MIFKIANNLYKIIYILMYVATGHLIYFAYLNQYSINYAVAIPAVIVVANFMMKTVKQLKYYNLVIILLISVSVYLTFDALINEFVYVFSIILISLISFIVHSLKINLWERFKENREELNQKSKEQELLLNNVETQIWYLKDIDRYGTANQAHADFLGLEREEIENKSIYSFLSQKEAENYINNNKKVFSSNEKLTTKEWIENSEGKKRLLSITKTPKVDNKGQVEYVVCSAEDITNRKKTEEKIKYLTFHDSLTGLYNRRYFEQELKRLDTKRQLPLSIIVGDINGLKLTNDAFGHKIGDELLKKVAQIIKESCRREDIVARWGGDEFAILLPQTSKENAKEICFRIKNNCEKKKIKLTEISISLGYATKKFPEKEAEEIFNEAENWMYKKKLNESKSFHNNIISSLKETLKEKTNETVKHRERIKELALKLGKSSNLSEHKLDDLELLADLHDLGKVAISEDILQKSDSLTDQEWEEVKQHTEIGCQIAQSSSELNCISRGILSHHENWDGSGYPQGLEGDEIPLIARIISIVDAYDVMINGRPYKEAVSKKEALEEIKKCAGSQFDPKLADNFIELMSK